MITELLGNPQEAIKLILVTKYIGKDAIGNTLGLPLAKQGVKVSSFTQAVQVFENSNGKKATKKQLEPHITELLNHCDLWGIDMLVVADATYFSYLTGKKFEQSIGSKLSCSVKGFEHISVIPLISHYTVQRVPAKRKLQERAALTLASILQGTYVDQQKFEFKNYEMVTDPQRAKVLLDGLLPLDRVAWDIETTGLHHMTADFITHGFAKNEDEAFTIVVHKKYLNDKADEMAEVVKDFFLKYEGSLLVHNVGFEGKFLAKKFWMKDPYDQQGIVNCFNHSKWDDSMLLAYAVLNSTERTPLGLKELAFEKYGNWDADIDIKNAINAPIDKLAYYNAIDVSATWYIWNKMKKQASESQFEFYDVTMRKTQVLFLKLMLTGIPINMDNVLSAKKELQEALDKAQKVFETNEYVLLAEQQHRMNLADKYNDTHKVARREPEDFNDIKFNFNSPAQLRILLFEIMEYEPIEFTDNDAPKTNRDSIKEFLDYEQDETKKEALEALIAFSEIAIILNTFLRSFENDSIEVAPGEYRLYGNYKNGGTQTFRPTANNPNLLNAPSGSKYGKLIKKCFKARDGFVIGSSDHASLQGRTAANLTKDANLIRIYNEGIDMHSFHATRYWPGEFPDFEDTVEYYAQVKHTHPEWRDKSKSPTFSMQFGGGPSKLAKLLKCDREEANSIYYAYHNELYPDMAKYNSKVGQQAENNGFVELGLGLRLQCPSVYSKDDGIKSAALRSVANATVQFWDVLTLIGIEKFQKRIEEEGYIGKVVMHSTIYDSVYMEIEDNIDTIAWVNQVLISEMTEDYMDDQPVKLEANLDISISGGTWADLQELPNGEAKEEITKILKG